jgi:hypothetical protein
MTLAEPERPRTRPATPDAPPAAGRRRAAPLYVPPVPERRPKLRALFTGLAALGLLAGITLVPWRDLPRGGAEWRQALQDVGVPRQYRDIMSGAAPKEAGPAPIASAEDPALTSLLGKAPPPPAPPPLPAELPVPAPSAELPAPAPAPKVFTARTTALATTPAIAPETPNLDQAPTYRVQIAATGSDAEAQAAWRSVRKAFPSETDGRALSIQQAEVKGRVVRRAIVTGFPSADAAKAFCAKLAAADRGCLLRGKGS